MNFRTLHFSIFFCNSEEIISRLGEFLIERKNKLNRGIEYCNTELSSWTNSAGGAMPEFFIGSNPDIRYTVFFSNMSDGWTTAARRISKINSCRSIQVSLSNLNSPFYGYYLLENGEDVRLIQYYKENKWIFFEKGTPLSYEYGETLLKPKKKFSNETIIDYLSKEGVSFDLLTNTMFEGFRLRTIDW